MEKGITVVSALGFMVRHSDFLIFQVNLFLISVDIIELSIFKRRKN